MPVVLELDFGGISIAIYFKDHNPPHVHARAAGAEAVFLLETVECVRSNGFTRATLGRIRDALFARRGYLQEKWNEYQG